ALAMAEAAVVETLEYTRERQAFGKPILDFQNTRFELAHCKTQVMATRAFVDLCIEREIAGELDAVTASMVKLQATDMLDDVVDRCLQLFGGYGYMMEYPIAQQYAAARVMRIYGGTTEIMNEGVARAARTLSGGRGATGPRRSRGTPPRRPGACAGGRAGPRPRCGSRRSWRLRPRGRTAAGRGRAGSPSCARG